VVNNGVFASYKVDGQQKRWRGTAETLAKEIPANATELKVTQMNSRVETFVTAGKPSKGALAPTGVGLELQVIAAVVIGGTSLMGGRGSIVSTFIGVLIIS
ncbi:hypothetical protein ABTK20_19955, partial [Acinetobacter baumannii]